MFGMAGTLVGVFKKANQKLHMVMKVCNASILGAEAECYEFKASLGYVARLFQNKQTNKQKSLQKIQKSKIKKPENKNGQTARPQWPPAKHHLLGSGSADLL
jgi:hypothetical protein